MGSVDIAGGHLCFASQGSINILYMVYRQTCLCDFLDEGKMNLMSGHISSHVNCSSGSAN